MDEQAWQRVDALAAKLGVTAEYLWEVLMRQLPVAIAQDALIGMIMLTACYGFWRLFKHGANEDNNLDFDEQEAAKMVGVIGAVATGILGLIGVGAVFYGLIQLANPEYYALQQVMEVLGR